MKLFQMFAQTRHTLPRAFTLMRDGRVPLWLKSAAVALAILIVSPLDLLGDIPILGLVDDVTLLALLTSTFVRFAERVAMRASDPDVHETATADATALALPST